MMTVSSAVYEVLLEHAEHFQDSLNVSDGTTSQPTSDDADGDDVHLRFGGAAICEMLHLRYKQIKKCPDSKRDKLSQEITILKAMTMKDKSSLPLYLKYRDRGFMYFPDLSFVPFLQTLHQAVRAIIDINSLQQDIIKVTHEELRKKADLPICFKETLAKQLPNLDTFSEDAVDSVYDEFAREVCNTIMQEVISAAKQQMASKKGLASTVDVNLRHVLLAHHAKLENKLSRK